MGKNNIFYSDWKSEDQKLREALCTLGNGYFATRGAAEESKDDGTHYPGTYLAGGYNRAQSNISGKTIENEDLVNFPNWLSRSLLMYRFYRLEKARELGIMSGYKGAMYPWQSGSNGREESQKMHLNLKKDEVKEYSLTGKAFQ